MGAEKCGKIVNLLNIYMFVAWLAKVLCGITCL